MTYRLARLNGAALIELVETEPREAVKPWLDLFAYDAETGTAIGRTGETRAFPRDSVTSVHAIRISGSVLDVTYNGVTVSRDRWRNEHILNVCGLGEA